MLIIAFVAAAASCSGGDVARDEGVPGVTEAGDLSVFDLEPGDCLGDLDDLTDQLKDVPVEPCTEVHRIEVYHLQDYPSETYPGEAELVTYADGVCLAEFGAYTGVDYFSAGTSLYFSYLYPTFDSWKTPTSGQIETTAQLGLIRRKKISLRGLQIGGYL